MSTLKNKSKSELIEKIELLEMQLRNFKDNENILLESEEKFSKTFNSSPNPMIITEVESGKIIDVNYTFEELSMYSKQEILGNNVFDLNLWANFEERENYIKKMKEGKKVSNFEMKIRTKSGDIRDSLISGKILIIQGKPYLLISGIDITERKQAEKALRESEGKYRNLVEQSPVAIQIFNPDGLTIQVNSAFMKQWNFSKETEQEIYKKYNILEDSHAKNLGVMPLIEKAFAGKEVNLPSLEYDPLEIVKILRFKKIEGRKRWIQPRLFPVKNKNSEVINVVLLMEDISEIKKAERGLRESEKKFREMADLLPQIVFETDLNANLTFSNKQASLIFGYSEKDLIANFNVLDNVIPEDRDRARENIKKIMNGKPVNNSEYTLIKKDGSTFPVLIYSSPVLKDDKPVGLRGIVVDISERKHTEEALRDSERKFREMADLSPLIVYEIDINRNLTFFNKRASAIFGFSEHDLMSKFNALDRVIPEDKDRALENMKKIMNGKSVSNSEYTLIKKDGSTFPVLVYSNRVMKDNKPVGFRGIIVDISERKQAEEALKESEEKFSKSFFDNPTPMIIINTKTGDRIDVNDSYVKMSGFDRNELLEGNINKRNLALSQKRLKEIIRKTIKKGYVSNEYFKFVNKTGEIITTLLSGTKLNVGDGNKVVYSCLDVTEREESQSKLKESEFFLSEAQRIANLGSYELDILSGYWTCTNELKSIFGIDDNYDRSVEGWGNIVHPEEKENMLSYFKNNVVKEHQNFDKEYRIIRINDNEERWVHGLGELEFNAEGQPVKMIGTIQDITENKIAEKTLMASRNQLRSLAERLQLIREEERATVAREIHDDLGQSLTALKMDISWMKKNPGMTEEIRTSKINTMLELIDNTIQTVKRIATELRPGILDDLGLVSAIEWQTKEFQNRSGIKCEFEIFVDEFAIDEEISIAVFRIFQESLTNVARHSGATKVTVTIEKVNNYLQLEIIDNGVGITEDQINNSNSLGLMGMNERVSVFRGKLAISRAAEGGTTVRVHIPITKTM